MAKPSTDTVPLAVRRSKRRNSAVSPSKEHSERHAYSSTGSRSNEPAAAANAPTTPFKALSKKRVRFSAPDASTAPNSYTTTGLTPYVRRTSLATPVRRVSAPIDLTPGDSAQVVQFTPFRQVLDARCKRRIRRNGLSEEINGYESDKRERAELEKEVQAKDEELRKLREELQTALQAPTDNPDALGRSSQRVDEVEAELAVLRESFNSPAAEEDNELADIDWTRVNIHKAGFTPGPPSEGGDTILIFEDTEEEMTADAGTTTKGLHDNQQDFDFLAMALDLETAKQEKRKLFHNVRGHMPSDSNSFQFADSPSRSRQEGSPSLSSLPSPPKDFYHKISAALRTATSRAEDADLALHSLEVELKSLGFAGCDSNSMLTEIASQFRTARLELERAVPGETVSGFENAKVLPELISKLRRLVRHVRDREGELKTMRDQQKTLKGNFEHSIIAAERASNRVRELENAIETGADEMLECRMKVQSLEKDNIEKDKNISSLITALEKYREDVTRLEQLVTQLESETAFKVHEAQETVQIQSQQAISDLEARSAAEEHGRRAAEESAIERLCKIQDLESALQSAQNHALNIQLQFDTILAAKEEEELRLTTQLCTREEQTSTQLGSLNTRVSNLSTALASANAEVDKLKVHKAKLEERVKREVEQGEKAVERMQIELMRSLAKVNESKNSYIRGAKIRVANSEIEDEVEEAESSGAEPMTPVSLVRFVDVDEGESVEGSVEVGRGRSRKGKGKGKRRYDSGIGMGTVSEDGQLDESDGVVLSSEADVEMTDVETTA